MIATIKESSSNSGGRFSSFSVAFADMADTSMSDMVKLNISADFPINIEISGSSNIIAAITDTDYFG